MSKVYESREEAMVAVREFQNQLEELEDSFDVYIECEDSCCGMYYVARYYDENGKTCNYFGV